MTVRLLWSTKAIRDLTAIHHELSSYGGGVAGRFIASLDNELELLREFPGIGSIRRSESHRLGTLRMVQVPKYRMYLLYYLHKPGSIRVLRILHSAQDVNRLMNLGPA